MPALRLHQCLPVSENIQKSLSSLHVIVLYGAVLRNAAVDLDDVHGFPEVSLDRRIQLQGSSAGEVVRDDSLLFVDEIGR